MEMALDIASWVFLMAGAAFCLIGAIGVLRLGDPFARLHGAGIIDTLGAGLILLGLILQAGFNLIAVKLALIGVFLFFTSPTTSHALARAMLNAGVHPDVREDKRGEDEPSNS